MVLEEFTRAIIFTHFGDLKHDNLNVNKDSVIKKYTRILKSYLETNKEKNIISVVYVYVDSAVKNFIIKYSDDGKFSIEASALASENDLFDILKVAEKNARESIKVDRAFPPVFHYIGIQGLINLLNNIISVDPKLIKFLAGRNGKFTYDSPKFVEAVIRLARGNIAHLAIHPIIRIDEDVTINVDAIEKLIASYLKMDKNSVFYFFSGTYGITGAPIDPVNDYAVRSHWFVPLGTKAGDNIPPKALSQINTFLADLSEVGATQLNDSEKYYSVNLKALMAKGRLPSLPARKSPQVISGAGLIMSRSAICLLPPFMNFTNLITWIDDFLKRRLHEAIGDIGISDLESNSDAKIKQVRYPDGVTKSDIDWSEELYFERLLCGCIFRRFITGLDCSPTNYSILIGDIVKYSVTVGSDRISPAALSNLRSEMIEMAEERYGETILCWQSVEYDGTPLYRWAKGRNNTYKKEVCNKLVEDAIQYLELVLRWPIFVRAVERLSLIGNAWLFEEV